MSMAADIVIYHDWPVIAGYVQIPNNQESDKTRVTLDEALDAIDGSSETVLSLGSGKCTGGHFGAQRFLRLPGLAPGASYASNPVDSL